MTYPIQPCDDIFVNENKNKYENRSADDYLFKVNVTKGG